MDDPYSCHAPEHKHQQLTTAVALTNQKPYPTQATEVNQD